MSDPRRALDAVGALPDVEIDIGAAAVQLARIDAPGADWRAAMAHLSALAHAIAARAGAAGADAAGRARALTFVLATDHDYRGDEAIWDDPAGANLIRVIARRRGLPVALGILWLHCARVAGWPAHGLDFPGHFLVGLGGAGPRVVLDVFAGGALLDAAALRGLIKAVEGPEAELRPGLLRPMAARDVLLRLQNNIRLRRLRGGALPGALACTRDMLRIAPGKAVLWREAAVMSRRLGRIEEALECLDRFVALVPADAAAPARAEIGELRGRLR